MIKFLKICIVWNLAFILYFLLFWGYLYLIEKLLNNKREMSRKGKCCFFDFSYKYLRKRENLIIRYFAKYIYFIQDQCLQNRFNYIQFRIVFGVSIVVLMYDCNVLSLDYSKTLNNLCKLSAFYWLIFVFLVYVNISYYCAVNDNTNKKYS